MTKIMYYLAIANFLAVLYFGWLLFAPVQLPIIYNEPFPVDKEEVKRGEELSWTMEVEKVKQYGVDSHKNIICDDGNLVTLATQNTNVPLGEHTITPKITIPKKTSLGMCYVQITNEYRINGLRNETQTMITRPFKVIE